MNTSRPPDKVGAVNPRRCLLALLAGLIGCTSTPTALPPDQGEVIYVYDGDTIEVRIAGKVERVRLLGIDTPESVSRTVPVECHGPEASATMKDLLPVGTVVRLERDVEPRDPYNRLLAYVYRSNDGLFVNAEIARRGEAIALTIEPNHARQPEIGAAIDEARSARRAMWGACPVPGS